MYMDTAVQKQVRFPMLGFSNIIFSRGKEIHYIGGAEVLPAPLDAQSEAEMIAALQSSGGEEARSRLIEHNLRLVVYIAKNLIIQGSGWRI